MPTLRRLAVTAITLVVILVHGAASWASIEVTGGPSCCCPDPTTCECFDHDEDHDEAPTLTRCAREPVQALMPDVPPAILPAPAPALVAPPTTATPRLVPVPMTDGPSPRPEKPPS